jgi:hypothetical protein
MKYYYPGTGNAGATPTRTEIYWHRLEVHHPEVLTYSVSSLRWTGRYRQVNQAAAATSTCLPTTIWAMAGAFRLTLVINVRNYSDASYTDWKLGVTKDVNGWVLGLAYVDTNAAGRCSGASDYQFYCFTNPETAAGGINFGSS